MTFREWRKQAGLTQVEVAKRLGVEQDYVSKLEHRRVWPGPLMVQRILDLSGGAITCGEMSRLNDDLRAAQAKDTVQG